MKWGEPGKSNKGEPKGGSTHLVIFGRLDAKHQVGITGGGRQRERIPGNQASVTVDQVGGRVQSWRSAWPEQSVQNILVKKKEPRRKDATQI